MTGTPSHTPFPCLILAVLLLLLLGNPPVDAGAIADLVGRPGPPFAVTTGEGHLLTLDMLRGRVVVLFYETRDVAGKNSDVKNLLNDLWHEQPQEIQDLIVRVHRGERTDPDHDLSAHGETSPIRL